MRTVRFLCLFLFMGCLTLPGIQEVHKKGNYVTPHVKWLSPVPKEKKPRVLFFANYWGGGGRYPAEMAQRFDMEFDCVTTGSTGTEVYLAGAESGAGRLEDLLREKWDAFVFFDSTPTDILAKKYKKLYSLMLFKIVRDGTALLLIDYDDPKVLKPKNKIQGPSIREEGNLKLSYYTIGKALGVQLQGFDMTDPQWRTRRSYARKAAAMTLPYSEEWRAKYEAMFRKIGEALFYAMRKPLPALNVEVKDGKAVVTGELPENGTLDLWADCGGDRIWLKKGEKVSKGDEIVADLPAVFPGDHFLSARVRKDASGYSFAGTPWKVPEVPGEKIGKITFTDGVYYGDPGKTVSGNVEYSGNGKVLFRIRDWDRRTLAEQVLEGQGGKASFAVKLEEWMPPMMTFEFSLNDGEKEVSRKYEYVNRIVRRDDLFEFSVWGHPYNHNAGHDLNRRLAELGITSIMQPGTNPGHSRWGMLDYQMCSVPVYDSIPGEDPKKCFLSDARFENFKEKRMESAQRSRTSGLKLVSLGDEVNSHYGCFAPDCLKAYREFLKEKYKGDLNKLNANWKSSFKDWSEVGLSFTPDKNEGKDFARYLEAFMGTTWRAWENHMVPRHVGYIQKANRFEDYAEQFRKKPKAKKIMNNIFMDHEAACFLSGNYARWFDRMEFKNEVFLRATKRFADYFSSRDKSILAGVEGTGAFDYLGNMGKVPSAMTWTGAYAEVNNNKVNELIRSITPENYVSATWFGYTTSASLLCERVWTEMMRRPSMIMFWTSTGHGMPSYYGICRPDYSLFTPAAEMIEQTKKLRAGLGSSLMRSKSVTDRIAILYSYPSAGFGARIHNGASYGYARTSHDGAIRLVYSLGRTFRYITGEMLEEKDPLEGYKVLLLPRVNAVSDVAAEKIRKFVKDGGTVIADVRTGIFTDHLVLREKGAFDEVSGLSREKLLPAAETKLDVPGLPEGSLFHPEPGVRAGTAKALFSTKDGLPVFLVNRYGKGTFLTLNFPFGELPKMENTPEAMKNVLAKAFDKIPADPEIVLETTKKTDHAYRTAKWRNGEMTILAVKSEPGGKKVYCAAIPEEKFVYGIEGEKFYGKTKNWKFELLPPKPEFFVLADRPLPEVAASAPEKAGRGETFFVCVSAKGMKGVRPVRVKFLKGGKLYSLYMDKEIMLKDGGEEKIPFRTALNDPEGEYTVEVTDIYTGKVAKLPLTIR
ncbi:MAG: beta-galactosidase trimerization domain-containing protein [Lentisphaeria bacterium]|nr:beta-galactosidase trimerization domain-containing protein [Lentisphaeria bacterium]